jgi:hypothetical protein
MIHFKMIETEICIKANSSKKNENGTVTNGFYPRTEYQKLGKLSHLSNHNSYNSVR